MRPPTSRGHVTNEFAPSIGDGERLKQTFGVALGRDLGSRKTVTKVKAMKAKNNLNKIRTLTLDLDFSDLSSACFYHSTVAY